MRDSTILTPERVVGAKAVHAVVAKWAETRPPWNNIEEALLVYAALCRLCETALIRVREKADGTAGPDTSHTTPGEDLLAIVEPVLALMPQGESNA